MLADISLLLPYHVLKCLFAVVHPSTMIRSRQQHYILHHFSNYQVAAWQVPTGASFWCVQGLAKQTSHWQDPACSWQWCTVQAVSKSCVIPHTCTLVVAAIMLSLSRLEAVFSYLVETVHWPEPYAQKTVGLGLQVAAFFESAIWKSIGMYTSLLPEIAMSAHSMLECPYWHVTDGYQIAEASALAQMQDR